jgi:hypothetical protein
LGVFSEFWPFEAVDQAVELGSDHCAWHIYRQVESAFTTQNDEELLADISEAAGSLTLNQPLVFKALNNSEDIDIFELAVPEKLQRLQETGHSAFIGSLA